MNVTDSGDPCVDRYVTNFPSFGRQALLPVRRAFPEQSLVFLTQPIGLAGPLAPAHVEFFGTFVRFVRFVRLVRFARHGCMTRRLDVALTHGS